MAADQLPAEVGEFARYLDGLLARLDPSGGWCAVFWQRDPEGMRACLDGREMPPWDMVEALLQDLAGSYGPVSAGPEADRARALHAAALAAYDARPEGRDALGDRLDVMLREQRYAAERRAALARHLTSATTPEQADALRVALAWAQDDHERADARCAELRSRMAQVDRREQGMSSGAWGDGGEPRGGAGPDSPAATRRHRAGPDSPVPGALGAYDATAAESGRHGPRHSASGPGPGPGEAAGEVVPGAFAASGEWRALEEAGSRGEVGGGVQGGVPEASGVSGGLESWGRAAGGAAGGAPEAFRTSTRWHAPRWAASPDRPGEGVSARTADAALGAPATAAPDVFGGRAEAGPDAPGGRVAAAPDVFGSRGVAAPAVPGGRAEAGPDAPGGRVAAAPDVFGSRAVAAPAVPGDRAAAAPHVYRVPAAPTPSAFTAQTPEPPAVAPPALAPPATAPPALDTPAHAPSVPALPALAPPTPSPRAPHPRKRRRGSARFAGMGDEEAVPVVEPPVAVPSPPATAAVTTGRTPRGARFAGVGEEVVVERPAPEADRARRADPAEVGRTVEVLARLRGEGRSGEAHALLAEIASWEPGSFPLLAERLHLAGLDADWQTLLWEATALPAGRLVAAADALVAAGRPEDGRQMLRQGVARPSAELGRAVLGLVAEGRDREVRVLLDAYVRARTPEEAARSAEVDPGQLVPLLLEAAGGVSQERRWDLVHALRVAGFAV